MLSHKLKNQVDRLERYDENNDDSDLYKIQSSSELLMKMMVVTNIKSLFEILSVGIYSAHRDRGMFHIEGIIKSYMS